MSDLAIFDVSYFVHAGMNSSSYMDAKVGDFPVGGLKYLFKFVSAELAKDNTVVLALDTKPTIRKNIYAGYKSGRKKRPDVYAQLEFLKQTLEGTGIPFFYKDGYEADDVIYSLFENNDNYFGYKFIRTGDKDISHNITDSRTILLAQGKDAISIKEDNFSSAIDKKVEVMYNTVSAYKVFFGDTSDSIPRPKYTNGYSANKCYGMFLNWYREYNITSPVITRTKDNLVTYFDYLKTLLDECTVKDIERNIELVFPMLIEEIRMPSSDIYDLYKPRIRNLLSAISDDLSLKTLSLTYNRPPDSMYTLMNSLAYDLKKDNLAIDNDIPVNNTNKIKYEEVKLVNLKEF